MGSRILAIASLTVRASVRSRLFPTLLVILTSAAAWLPRSLRSDGTLDGQLRVALSYTLGSAGLILGGVMLWASCEAIAQDIAGRQIRLIVVKPIRRCEIWLGRWLGLLAVSATLLAAVGIVACVTIRRAANSPAAGPEERRAALQRILVGRRRIPPRPEDVEPAARERLRQLIDQGVLPRDQDPGPLLESLRVDALARRAVVSPGAAKEWIFDASRIPAGLRRAIARHGTGGPDAAAVALRVRVSSSHRDGRSIRGRWMLFVGGRTDPIDLARTPMPDGVHLLPVPPEAVAGGDRLTVRFVNADAPDSCAAMFDPAREVELLVRDSAFESNLARSLLIMLCQIALIVALGLTMGTLFSLPVATFVAAATLAVALLSHGLADAAAFEPGESRGPLEAKVAVAGRRVVSAVEFAVGPMFDLSPLQHLSDGILVSWGATARAAALMAGLGPALLLAVSGWVLSRRELALPG